MELTVQHEQLNSNNIHHIITCKVKFQINKGFQIKIIVSCTNCF